MENKEDPLDELFLNEEQTKYFHLGEKQIKLRFKIELRKAIEKETIKQKEEIKSLKHKLTKMIRDRDYWKRKVGWVEKREERLEKNILKLKGKI